MTYSIVAVPGDGIGPEVATQAIRVLEAAAARYQVDIEVTAALIGGAAIDAENTPLPERTLALCEKADAVFLGAVGGPQWGNVPVALRPEQGLLDLRRALGLFANLRPAMTYPELADASPLRADKLAGVDIIIVRELTGGIYFGKRGRTPTSAFDTCQYTVAEIERVCRVAGRLAQQRRGRVTSVDKANVLDTSRLWRETATRIYADEFPDLEVEHLYVDAAAMHLLSRPADFDVMVMDNMFGDILTDEASMLAGSLGLLPSASIGASRLGVFEPIHGSAPDIAGQNKANPIGAILSMAMMLRYSLDEPAPAGSIEHAVHACLQAGYRTADLAGTAGKQAVGTAALADAIIERIS